MFVTVLIFLVSSYNISFNIPQLSATGIDSLLGTVIATSRHHCSFFCLYAYVCMFVFQMCGIYTDSELLYVYSRIPLIYHLMIWHFWLFDT